MFGSVYFYFQVGLELGSYTWNKVAYLVVYRAQEEEMLKFSLFNEKCSFVIGTILVAGREEAESRWRVIPDFTPRPVFTGKSQHFLSRFVSMLRLGHML